MTKGRLMFSRASLLAFIFVFSVFPSAVKANQSSVTVPMKAFSDSGQSGAASITRSSGSHVTITILLKGETAGEKEPAFVYEGTCSNLARTSAVTLNPVVGGKSTTTQTLPALGLGHVAIVVRKGLGAGMETTVSCGQFELI